MDLFAVDDIFRRDSKGTGEDKAVFEDISGLVPGVEGEVERVVGFGANPAFPGGDKVGDVFVTGEVGEEQEVDAVDPGFYHRLII